MPDKKMPQLSREEVQSKIEASGLTDKDIEQVIKIITDYKEDSNFGKTLALILQNKENTNIGDLIAIISKASPDSDLGKVLTVLKKLDFQVKLSDLFNYIQGKPDAGVFAFLKGVEEIPVIGWIVTGIRLPIDYLVVRPIQFVFSLFSSSKPEVAEKPQAITLNNGEKGQVVVMHTQLLPNPTEKNPKPNFNLSKAFPIDAKEYTHVVCSDFVHGKTGLIQVFVDGKKERVPENGTRELSVDLYNKAKYITFGDKQPDLIAVQPINKNTGLVGPTQVIKVEFMASK